jgi:hypothetical protein
VNGWQCHQVCTVLNKSHVRVEDLLYVSVIFNYQKGLDAITGGNLASQKPVSCNRQTCPKVAKCSLENDVNTSCNTTTTSITTTSSHCIQPNTMRTCPKAVKNN